MTPGPPGGLAGVVEAVLQLEGLTAQVGPFALPSDTCDRAPGAVAAVCEALAVPLTFDGASGRDRDFAAVALAGEIARAQRAPGLGDLSRRFVLDEARRLAADDAAGYRRHRVARPDGAVVTAVEAGPPDAPAVLVSAPCSHSHRLSLPWLAALRATHRCVVVETRGTSERIEDPADFDRRGHDVEDQVGDLVAVAEVLALRSVHVMGICGGATVALAATAERPDLVASLSLWHADIALGEDVDRTEHQVNLRALLDLAGESRETADWLRAKLTSGPMSGVPDGVGPLVVRPYATAELFHRYARLTTATMRRDSREAAAAVRRPCLVVTSADDDTAHPSGSRALAAALPDARLTVLEHGNHLDAFRATSEQVGLLRELLGR